MIVTALIGLFQGSFVAIIGVPSFVVTLAGLLFWQGVILYSIGDQGVIVIDDSLVNNVANYFFSDRGATSSRRSRGAVRALDPPGRGQSQAPRDHSDNLIVVALKLIGFARLPSGIWWANRSEASRSPSCS